MRPSERLAWAAEVVAPQETDRVLEVGCGHGVLLSLLAARVTAGEVVGVDRSATMTAAAGRRNADAVASGRVRLVTAALAPFASVRQKVLLTDDEPRQRAFYESLGFAEIRDLDDGSLRAFVKLD